MTSLVVLMIEEEQPDGLSARKLVVETAKHNVITGYTAETGLDLLRRFPRVDAVLVHGALLENRESLLKEIKAIVHGVPIILATPVERTSYPDADFVIDSHRPHDLLALLRQNFGLPQ